MGELVYNTLVFDEVEIENYREFQITPINSQKFKSNYIK